MANARTHPRSPCLATRARIDRRPLREPRDLYARRAPGRIETITMRDGRQLEYLEHGPADAPVMLVHGGTPGAASEAGVVQRPAEALGLRTITYSRPGYGGSTERPGRTVADAAEDVVELLDDLGIGEFVSFGWSGGGPHALACAALLPDRCRAAAVLAGIAPHDAAGLDLLDGMDRSNVEEFGAAFEGYDAIEAFLTPQRDRIGTLTADTVIDELGGLLSDVDQAALTGEMAADSVVSFRRALERGIAGWRDDDLAFVTGWGFELATIRVPVAIWQGRQDRMVPFAHGEWLAQAIPSAEPHLFDDEGHLSLIAQADAIFGDLLRLAA
jgi:pimeloyl-ACP methyl ester carboxylesterase